MTFRYSQQVRKSFGPGQETEVTSSGTKSKAKRFKLGGGTNSSRALWVIEESFLKQAQGLRLHVWFQAGYRWARHGCL